VTYCDEHVCLIVRQGMTGTTLRSLLIFLSMLPMAMARSSSNRVTISHGEVLGVFFPTDNGLQYGDGARNTDDENSSVFSLILMR